MYICGQKNLLERFDALVGNDKFPRFIILVGNKGTGKKLLADYISKKIGANFVPCGIKAEDVRDIVLNAYSVSEKTLYMFFDCDDMSVVSKNTLLKVTEEPPNNSYFVMTVQDISTVLPTIVSRGTVFYMEPYSQDDIIDFIDHKRYEFTDIQKKIVLNICTNPEEVTIASKTDIENVYNLADKFIQFIGTANMSNELKIVTMLNTKKDDLDKVDPIMFMRCVMLCCNNYICQQCNFEDVKAYHNIISMTSKYLSELLTKGASKQMVLDNWIVDTHMKISGGEF